jgi:hypothetical protein
MLVSIFGQLEFGDYESVLDWSQGHAQAHRSLQRAAAMAGIALTPTILSGERIDDDWFGRHGIAHAGLQRLYQPDGSVSAGLMISSLIDWESKDRFYDWHMMHDQIHTRLNAALGIR